MYEIDTLRARIAGCLTWTMDLEALLMHSRSDRPGRHRGHRRRCDDLEACSDWPDARWQDHADGPRPWPPSPPFASVPLLIVSRARIDRLLPTLGSLPDAELIRLCLEDDQNAWEALVLRHQGLVYSTALEVGLPADDAGDIFQEVWLELHRSLRRLRNPNALPRWLIIATRRLSWKVAVRNRRIIAEIPPDLVDPWSLPDESVEFMQCRARVEGALQRLGDPCAQLLRLLFLEWPRPSHRAVAQRTGLAMGSIGPTRNRCLAKLRKVLRTWR